MLVTMMLFNKYITLVKGDMFLTAQFILRRIMKPRSQQRSLHQPANMNNVNVICHAAVTVNTLCQIIPVHMLVIYATSYWVTTQHLDMLWH